ncbi:hypothetical protein [Flavobacterium sp. CS20]|jgi:hypothetical protein|uniref:hypothetical protein n=1 Tax=Flavobacterium sp. CS20 TaxID=2775246 RepID=UPI001B39F14E|nr:hypothetical protein [Flavobacterium sp. CS20]QTY27611.1 hypothetical protein IGB25_03450 [Flavobacterium sp. CS20]
MKGKYKIVVGTVALILIIYLMFKLFYPTKLTITVPKNYQGQITLVLSNVNKDILKVDENGIGYITKQTFEKAHSKPIVVESDGTNVSDRIVGFNPSTFWAIGKSSYATEENSSTKELEVQFLSFELVPKDKKGEKQYYSPDLIELIDKTRLYGK